MDLREELLIGKPLEPGHELILAILLTREYVSRLTDQRLFKPEGITDQQFNVLRILRGGPQEGHLIREIRRRMISKNADVPRLVDRMVRAGLVQRQEDPNDRRGCRVRLTAEGLQLIDRLAPVHQALCDEVGDILEAVDGRRIVELLDSLREGIRARLRP